MKRIKEVLFVLALAGGFLIPSAFAGQWWLFGTFILFFTCFGLVEWVAVSKTGKSVSQHFWALKEKNKAKAWIVIAGMIIGWTALILHLLTH